MIPQIESANSPLLNHTVYTIGYRAPRALEKVQELINALDIRWHPGSRFHPQWSRKQLQARFGEQNYEHLEALGNVNYRHPDEPWQLCNAEEGLSRLEMVLSHRDVILMCGCPDPDKCHRRLVCQLLSERLPDVRIVHLVAHQVVTVRWEEELHAREVSS